MKNNVSFNILASYAYLNNDKVFCDWCFGLHKDGIANVMIDSGAFTLHNAKQKRDWLTVDNYCRFLEKYENYCEKYVMLDVVGNDIQSKKNYELMVSRGFEPMFVLTMFDKDWQYLNETLGTNPNMGCRWILRALIGIKQIYLKKTLLSLTVEMLMKNSHICLNCLNKDFLNIGISIRRRSV